MITEEIAELTFHAHVYLTRIKVHEVENIIA